METSIINSKGQIVIPEKIRKKYGFKNGLKVVFIKKDNMITIQSLTKKYFEKLAGILDEKGKMLRSLMDGKRKEREL